MHGEAVGSARGGAHKRARRRLLPAHLFEGALEHWQVVRVQLHLLLLQLRVVALLLGAVVRLDHKPLSNLLEEVETRL